MTIVLGNTVQMKTGGPWMKVSRMGSSPHHLWCQWIDESNTLREARYSTESLRLCWWAEETSAPSQ